MSRILNCIRATYSAHPHCFKQGCGKQTLSWWVWEATGIRFTRGQLRRALIDAEKAGLVVVGKSKYGNYKTYELRGI